MAERTLLLPKTSGLAPVQAVANPFTPLMRVITREPSTPLSRQVYLCCCLLLLLLGAAVRWLLMLRFYPVPNSDQAIVGLMARHILAGERPVFYWGQPYNGALEQYLTAGVFRIFGESDAGLHVASIGFSMAFVGAATAVCRRLYGMRLALLCGLYLTLCPAILMEFSIWPGSTYLAAMALGTWALALALPVEGPPGWWRLPLIAFLLGLALWAQPLGALYLPAVLLLLAAPAWHRWHQGGQRLAMIGGGVAALAALIVALGPMLAENFHTHWYTVQFLAHRTDHIAVSRVEALRRTVVWTGPVLLGLIPPTEDPVGFTRFVQAHPYLQVLALALCAGVALNLLRRRHTLWRWIATLPTARPAGEAALLVLGVGLLLVYLLSNWSRWSWSATEPRYLLTIYTLTPPAVRALFPARATRYYRVATAGLFALLIGIGLASNLAAQHFDDWSPVAQRLTADRAQVVYGDYWVVYRLAFASGERLTPVVLRDDLGLGQNRYHPYLHAASQQPRGAWVVIRRSTLQHTVEDCLARHRLSYRRFSMLDLEVYEQQTPSSSCKPALKS